MKRYQLSKAGINATEGITRFDGDKKLYEQVLYGFLKDEHFTQLNEAIAQQDIKAAFAAAHSLKGVAGNLSMTRLFEDICPLVEELRAGSFAAVDTMLPQVEKDYEDVIAVLTQEAS